MAGKRDKISNEMKLKYAKLCFENKLSKHAASRELGVSKSEVLGWVYRYREQGELAFLNTNKIKNYSEQDRQEAVQSYLNGEGSYREVAAKYGLRSESTLKKWVKMYNSGRNLSRKKTGGRHMKTSKETTLEERIRIVKDFIESGKSYGEIAEKYDISYQQVYGWVRRFTELGESGLEDRRGRRKIDQTPRNENEKLKIEIERLKHQLNMTEMERDLLKKVSELKRKARYHK